MGDTTEPEQAYGCCAARQVISVLQRRDEVRYRMLAQLLDNALVPRLVAGRLLDPYASKPKAGCASSTPVSRSSSPWKG